MMRLYSLSHLLLPAFETIEELLDADSGDGIALYALEEARAVLAQLEEALK